MRFGNFFLSCFSISAPLNGCHSFITTFLFDGTFLYRNTSDQDLFADMRSMRASIENPLAITSIQSQGLVWQSHAVGKNDLSPTKFVFPLPKIARANLKIPRRDGSNRQSADRKSNNSKQDSIKNAPKMRKSPREKRLPDSWL